MLAERPSRILTLEEYLHAREIIGDGKLQACRDQLRKRVGMCLACCKWGAPLLPGEVEIVSEAMERGEISSKVKFLLTGVEECLGSDKECLLGEYKPLFCRAYPFWSWENWVPDPRQFIHFDKMRDCPGLANAIEEDGFVRAMELSRFLREIYGLKFREPVCLVDLF